MQNNIKIAIYCEINDGFIDETSYELISKADELRLEAKNLNGTSCEITAVALSDRINQDDVKKTYVAGTDDFVFIKHELLKEFNQSTYSSAFCAHFEKNQYDIILFPATLKGRMVAPRITTKLNCGLTADCTGLEFIIKNNEIKLASTRPTFGAELMATIISKIKPQCATIRPKTFKASFKYENKSGNYSEFYPEIKQNTQISIIKKIKEETDKNSFDDADIILCAGFGLYDGKENVYIKKLKDLSDKIGAKFAVTRKLVDYGVENSKYQIGQTGTSVSPKIYIAFGVSGAIQHIMGMKNSKTIIAINSDKDAEIFNYSDYKIIADAKEVIDELLN